MDFIYVVGVLAFFALTWGLVRLCEKVSEAMGALEALGAVLALGLFVYLLVALLAPEKLS